MLRLSRRSDQASGCTRTCGCDGCMGHWERPRTDRRRFEDGRAVSRGACERDAAAGVRQRRRTPENGAGTICRRALPVTVCETLRPALPPTPFTALVRTVSLEYNYARRLGGRPSPPALRPSSPLRLSRPRSVSVDHVFIPRRPLGRQPRAQPCLVQFPTTSPGRPME